MMDTRSSKQSGLQINPVGDLLRGWRNRRAVSQADLAFEAGISINCVRRWPDNRHFRDYPPTGRAVDMPKSTRCRRALKRPSLTRRYSALWEKVF